MGRKSVKIRKAAIVPERSPSGRPSRSLGDYAAEYTGPEIKRMQYAAMTGLRDPEWGTELGRMFLERKLSGSQYGTAKWWRDMAARCTAAMASPWPVPRSVSLERRAVGAEPDTETEEGRKASARDREAVERFREAHAVLMAAGMLSERYVRDLCESDIRPLGTVAFAAVIEGLQRLVDWRELTRNGKSASGR